MALAARATAVRLSDADRALAAERLRTAWLDGRLTLPEFEQRLAVALRCRLSFELEELLADLAAPAGPALPPLAGWGRRSGALVLDHLFLSAAAALAIGFGALVGHAAAAVLATAIAAPFVALSYFTVTHGGRSGRSVGERICGIAVRSDPHRAHALRRTTYGQAFGRAVMLYVFAAISVWGVGALNFLWPLWDIKRQAWHDKVAGTIVVRADALTLDQHRWTRRWHHSIPATVGRWLQRIVLGPSCAHSRGVWPETGSATEGSTRSPRRRARR